METKTDSRLKKFIKEYGFVFLAFLIPLLLMWLIYIALEVYPFGKNSVLVLDLNGQYVYFFEELRAKVLEGGSMLYSWARSLGGEFMGIYAYYISSPFSYLVVLFPKDHITEALLTIILLKCGCLGASMSIYLFKTTKYRRVNKLNIIIFSTMYALSAYAVVQAHNTMWMENVIMLPLIALGIEKLINERKFILFVSTFIISLMTSFYIGYMTCIFVAAYFFYYYFAHNINNENNLYQEKNHFIKSLGRIVLYSAIALCAACVILLPAIYSMTFGKTTFSNPQFTFTQKFKFIDMLVKFLPGSYDTVRPEGLPFLYCGVLILILVPIYFMTKQINARERILSGAIICFFVFSFNILAVDTVWHCFQKPNWLNYRYSFMLIFLLLVFAYRAIEHIDKIDYKWVIVIFMFISVTTLIIQKNDYEFVDDLKCIWLTLALLAIYIILLHLKTLKHYRRLASQLLLIFVCVEMFLGGLMNAVGLDSDVRMSKRTSYRDYFEKMQPVVDYVKDYDSRKFGSEFYRMEKTVHRKTNDCMTLGFYGISNSTSTLNAPVIRYLHQLGYSSKSNWTKYLGGTYAADSLLGIRYVITESTSDLSAGYEHIYIDPESGYYVWYNPNALSLAYVVNDEIEGIDLSEEESPFLMINQLFTSMTGEKCEVFKTCNVQSTDYDNIVTSYVSEHRKFDEDNANQIGRINFIVDVPAGHEGFLYFPTDYPREAKLKINGTDSGTVMGNETDRVISIGKYDADTSVSLTVTLEDDPLYIMTGYQYFYYFDEAEYAKAMEILKSQQLDITEFSDTKINGTINVTNEDGLLYTSIPYDDGWHVRIDGEEADLVKVQNSLLAVRITPGEHEIEMHYMPKCFVIGLSLTIFGFAAFFLSIFLYARRTKKLRTEWAEKNRKALEQVFLDEDETVAIATSEDLEEMAVAVSDDIAEEDSGDTNSDDE